MQAKPAVSTDLTLIVETVGFRWEETSIDEVIYGLATFDAEQR